MISRQEKRFWYRLFGSYPENTKVMMKKRYQDEYTGMHVWKGCEELGIIPPSKFVGVILGKEGERFYKIKWIADGRKNPTCYIWGEGLIQPLWVQR